MEIMADSNIILDIATEDPNWFEWSSQTVAFYAETHIFIINPIIYSEVSIGFENMGDTDAIFPSEYFHRIPIPYEAAFLAGKCFLEYRRRGGQRRSPLPDFFIGAHAVIMQIPLITRDVQRYRTYFPELQIITP
ncbi:MAG: type II toxin-antitoxin system VapC family toxin [Desulfobacteraceae bacterium]|nr:type II toxin-antitoxin system VapC family toxin [Desulfobacteraceae bacterium]